MGQCWPLQMPPTPKAVLISLADNANDSGECWPSIDTISQRTCYSRRAVIDAIAWLERAGALIADRSNGRHTSYRLTLASFRSDTSTESPRALARRASASANAAPVSAHEPVQAPHQCGSRTGADAAQTSADAARDRCGSRTLTVKEPSRNRQKKESAVARPASVNEQVWSDWLALRRSRRADVTPTALAGVEREAAKAGWTLQQAMAECCARGWIGFKAEWVGQRPAARASPADERDARLGEWLGQLTGGLAGRPPRNKEIIDVDPDHDGPRRIA